VKTFALILNILLICLGIFFISAYTEMVSFETITQELNYHAPILGSYTLVLLCPTINLIVLLNTTTVQEEKK